MISDADLMVQLARGDDLALNELIRRWREKLASFLYRMTQDRATALDLTQETFVRLYRNCVKYRPTAAFPSFLFNIAANLARDHARWRSRHPSIPMEDSHEAMMPDTAARPDAAAIHREDRLAIDTAIAALPVDLRQAILLFVEEDLGYSEIAAIAGCSPKAVETRIYRARQLLKKALAEDSL